MAKDPEVGKKDTLGTSNASQSSKKEKEKVKPPEQASVGETLSFVFGAGGDTVLIFTIGLIGALGNGAVFPALAYLFSNSFTDIAGAATEGLEQVRELAFTFMIVGAYALVMATIQTSCFEIVAYRATQNLRLQWFKALLRQDASYFDVYDIGGIASGVGPNSNRYRRGLGRKFGEGIQFFTTGVGGIGYAMWASWRVALVVLAITPLISISALSVVNLNQSKSTRAAKSYSKAGSVAYSTVSGIKTVLSLNAIPTMLKTYFEATQDALTNATSILLKQGFANGSMLGSFICLYAVLCLYGTYLLYSDVEETGCDPSGGIEEIPELGIKANASCENAGSDVFGAMLGIAFAAQGISQVGNFLENFAASKAAAYNALAAINRKPGSKEEIIYHEEGDEDKTMHTSGHVETSDGRIIKAILPKYEIDATSDKGLKPENVSGRLTFDNVKFSYPTRPGQQILNDLSIDIPAGKTVAFVGPSGGGKSTVVKLLERFYDPKEGSVQLDGTDLKEINVKHLRSLIGYVGQEPTLFATTIEKNIQYGNPSATKEEIYEAARKANAHDFISSFPDGYDTQVGDKGTQLSGGQKQRIAIARVLVSNPKLLILDEATSALDSESELVVQEALDNVLKAQKCTTAIIAHRLSTIRNADIIAVVSSGSIVETGTHDELMVAETGYYRNLVEKQHGATATRGSQVASRMSTVESTGDLLEKESHEVELKNPAADKTVIEFKEIGFSYPTRPNKKILDKFSLKIRKGETVALVGPSGGGKSTTVSLIERFYDPSDGVLEYRGEDVKSLNVAWYRDQIGYVGQEPTLFNETIANNIAYGLPNATRQQIEEASKSANAYNFIKGFPEGFDTPVGERGAQLSGGQKQRIAIARALVKKPEILLLDEATSALDNESEAIVQEALNNLMQSQDQTCIVIAHRLTTIRNADRIAFIGDGHVKEFGTHEELMEKPNGRYKRLVESQGRGASTVDLGVLKKKDKVEKTDEDEEEKLDWKKELEEEEAGKFNIQRIRKMAAPDTGYILAGSIGALLAGSVFPMWGLLFAETIELLFRRVLFCDDDLLEQIPFDTCQEYWDDTADDMRTRSYTVAIYWGIVAFGSVFGNMLTFWGFGNASERLNKRVRDAAFSSLVRQEVAYFDKRSVGKITSQLQDDAARLHTFTGEPIRAFLIAVASVFTGLVLSFSFMWPFALLALGCIPMMGFATSLEMKNFLGEDQGDDSGADELNSPGGIVVETLLNIGTVSALTMEDARFDNYEKALENSEPTYARDGFFQGVLAGLSQFIQQWINGLQMWFGAWMLFNFPEKYEFNDFLISNFAILFALFGLGAAFQDVQDKSETEKSAGRIFYLLDRESKIDPLGEGGKKLAKGESEHFA